MLKPAQPPAQPERPIGELVHELVEEGKAYARSEFDLARTIASCKARALAVPAALLVGALFIGMAALNAFAFAIVLSLARFVGPLAAGIIGLLVLAAIAGALARYAIERARRLF